MKILITHELFPPDVHGGGEKVVYEIAKRLIDKGIEVQVLTTGDPKIKRYENIPTARLPINRYLMNLAFPWILKYAKNADLIQTNNYNACYPSYIAAKMSKKPIVCLIHGMYGNNWLRMRGPIFGTVSRMIEKFQICHEYEKVIFLSNFAKNAGIEIGIKRELTEVIRPGIEFKKYRVKAKEGYVLFVGRLAKQKGLECLLKVAEELPNIEFKLVGKGEEENKLKSVAPKNVSFLGFVTEDKLIDLYSKALIFCLPSIAETFGFVLLEAMASGCAIVSTVPLDFEGIRIDTGDVRQLTEAIKYLTENPRIAEKMGEKNREIAKKYVWDDFIKKIINIYQNVLETKRI